MLKRLMMVGMASMALGCAMGDDTTQWQNTQTSPVVVNPNCPYQVYRHSPTGWLLSAPVVHFVFWGSYWQQDPTGYQQQSGYQSAWSYMFSTGHVFQRLAEYGTAAGFLDPNGYNTNPNLSVPTEGGFTISYRDGGSLTEIDDTGIPGELNNEIQAGQLPAPTHDSLYVVFLPSNTSTVNMVNGDDGGYHTWAQYGDVQYAYAIIGYYPNNYTDGDSVVSHEIYEAMTDPDVSTGYYGVDGEHEVADLCAWVETSIDGYQVQKVWSEDVCSCL